MIRSLRADGVFHFADGEPGDLFRWQGQWWVVVSVADSFENERTGTARPAQPADVLAEVLDTVQRVEEMLRSVVPQ